MVIWGLTVQLERFPTGIVDYLLPSPCPPPGPNSQPTCCFPICKSLAASWLSYALWCPFLAFQLGPGFPLQRLFLPSSVSLSQLLSTLWPSPPPLPFLSSLSLAFPNSAEASFSKPIYNLFRGQDPRDFPSPVSMASPLCFTLRIRSFFTSQNSQLSSHLYNCSCSFFSAISFCRLFQRTCMFFRLSVGKCLVLILPSPLRSSASLCRSILNPICYSWL